MILPRPAIRLNSRKWRLPPEARLVLACVLAILLFGRPKPETQVADDSRSGGLNLHVPYRTDYYFGGRQVRGTGATVTLGAAAGLGGWASFLPFSAARPAQARSCLVTAPPATPAGKPPRDIADDLPGLYGAPWVASVNGYLIAALHVTVPRHGGSPPPQPVLQIYRQGGPPAFSQPVPVSVTRGNSALLYRMFVGGPITCIDLVIPNGAGAGTAHVYYPFRGRLYDAAGVFTVQR